MEIVSPRIISALAPGLIESPEGGYPCTAS
jgi:hypothetical protein